jgi:hypothetical protein
VPVDAAVDPTTPTRASVPVMLTLEAPSLEVLRERMRIGETLPQHRHDRQGALLPRHKGQHPVAVPLDDHELLISTASPRQRPVLGRYRQPADGARCGLGPG